MIVAQGSVGARQLVVVALDFENLDKLREGAPASSDIDGLPLILVHAKPTMREAIADLVENRFLPQSALDEYVEPEHPGDVRTWTPGDGTRPADVSPAQQRERAERAVVNAQRQLERAQRYLAAVTE